VILAGELEGDEDLVVDPAGVSSLVLGCDIAEERPRADAHDRKRLHLAEEDARGIELVAAEFGHQAAARAVVEPPSHQFFHALEVVLAELVLQLVVVFFQDRLEPAVAEFGGRLADALGLLDDRLPVRRRRPRPREIAVPERPDMVDVPEHTGVDQLGRVGVEHAVMPLVADREDAVCLLGNLDHLLALADGAGHQLLAQDVLAGAHARDRDRGVQVKGQGDDDGLEVFFLLEHLLEVRVHVAFGHRVGLVFPVHGLVALARGRGRLAFDDAPTVVRADVAEGDELEILGVVVAHEDAPLVAATDEGGLNRFALHRLVAEVGASRDGSEPGRADRHALHEPAAGQVAGRGVEVSFAKLFVLGRQVESHRSHSGLSAVED
jgi:hypothetical protein